jgi:hypothetical protein
LEGALDLLESVKALAASNFQAASHADAGNTCTYGVVGQEERLQLLM